MIFLSLMHFALAEDDPGKQPDQHAEAVRLFSTQGCAACHQLDKPGIGPPLGTVGRKYAADPRGLQTLIDSLQAGSRGKWGQSDMPPQSHLEKEDALHLARWILTLRPKQEASQTAAQRTTPDEKKPTFHSPLLSERRVGTVVEVSDTPVVYRTYLPEASSRAIAVGLPGGRSYAFDAAECRLLYCWSGGFLDMEKSWTGHGGWYAKLLGKTTYRAPTHFPLSIGKMGKTDQNPKLKFKGYRLVDGIPEFLYQVNGQPVSQRIFYRSKSDQKPARIIHHFSLPGVNDEVFFLPTENLDSYQSDDAEPSDSAWRVRPEKRSSFSISITLQP